jgi:hypothetical protein
MLDSAGLLERATRIERATLTLARCRVLAGTAENRAFPVTSWRNTWRTTGELLRTYPHGIPTETTEYEANGRRRIILL